MNQTLITLLAYLFIYLVYLTGKFIICLRFGIHEQHIFLGKGKDPVFTFPIAKVKVSLGLFIPLPYLARFYRYQEDGTKKRIRMAWEYTDKPVIYRLIVNFGGAIAMLVMAVIMFLAVGFTDRETFIGKDQVDKYGIYPDTLARSYGFKKGDRITAINGRSFERHIETKSRFLEQDPTVYTILRGNQELTIEVGQDMLDQLDFNVDFFTINAPFEVSGTVPNSEAERIGLQNGDIITQVDGNAITSIAEFGESLARYAGDSISLQIKREDQQFAVEAVVPTAGKLGFSASPQVNFTAKHKRFDEAILYGLTQPFKIIGTNAKAFKKIIFNEPAETKNLSGPVGIAQLFGESSWIHYLKITGILLSIFTFYEFLPLPKTAMTRTIPLIFEGFFNKPFSLAWYQRISNVFWALIFLLFALTIFNDIARLL